MNVSKSVLILFIVNSLKFSIDALDISFQNCNGNTELSIVNTSNLRQFPSNQLQPRLLVLILFPSSLTLILSSLQLLFIKYNPVKSISFRVSCVNDNESLP